MEFRKLGNTGYDVSTIGFGLWQLGGGRWAAPDRRGAVRLLREARDLGVNIFDAAVVYGQYRDDAGRLSSRSQELLGEAFGGRRSEVIYCCKVGQFDELSHRADFAPRRLVQQLTESLKRLRTDSLDICLIHAPSLADVRSGRAIAVLQTLQETGMVRNIGYSFENEPEHVRVALQQDIDVLMLQYNLLDRECEDVIEDARLHGVGVLAGGPLKRGYLTGRYPTAADLPREDDYWRWNLDKNPLKVSEILSQTCELMRVLGGPRELRRAAFELVLGKCGVSSAIVGHRTLAEIEENIDSSRARPRAVIPFRGPSREPFAAGLSMMKKEAV